MSRVVLSGYYGFHNTGDEAILEATLALLRRCRPDLELVVLSADPAHTQHCYGVEAVSRTRITAVLQALRHADLLISGGGGLLQDVTSRRSVPYYLGIMELAMRLGTRVAVFAQGIGPLQYALSRRLVKRVLSRVDWLSVRDPASMLLLRELGVTREIQLAPDPVFALQPPSRPEIVSCRRKHGLQDGEEEKPLVGVSLRPLPGEKDGSHFYNLTRAACLYLEREKGARLIFLPFQQNEDLETGRSIWADLSPGHRIIEESIPPREMLCLIGGLDLLLGMRLHSLIFAAVCGVPFVGLPYDPKVSAFLNLMDEEAPSVPPELHIPRLCKQLELALERGEGRMGELAARVSAQKEALEAMVQRFLPLL
ncbi:MAG: polysaccharide pyruvyl transferase CsaB [Bacillota bacterium]